MKILIFSILFSFMLLFSCKPAYHVQKTEQAEYILTDTSNNAIDSSVNAIIIPYREKVAGEMSAVIAESEHPLEKGIPESSLGDFVADACMTETKKNFYPQDGRQPDFAFLNNGGLRRALPAGKITRGDVFELMPFENQLVVLTLDGKLVKKIFNFIASKDGAPISGARMKIRNHQATEILIQNAPLDTMKTYKALTSDYLANGGDSFDMLPLAQRESVNLKVRDAILNNLAASSKEGKKINVAIDGRITNAQ